VKIGMEYDGDTYLMIKLRDKKLHPEVGIAEDGWIGGIGYDLNRNTSLDLFVKKDWDFKGKPNYGVGVSFRF